MLLEFPQDVCVTRMDIRFQGGFAGNDSVLFGGSSEITLEEVAQFFPKDSNSLQISF